MFQHISTNVLQALFGLKATHTSMWVIENNINAITETIEPDQLGLVMQIILLLTSVVVLEVAIRSKKHR